MDFENKSQAPVTLADIARELGVSKSTVSRVVNCKGRIGPETRKRVQEMIAACNYVPNPVAKGLAIGAAAHAIGNSKAMEIGDIEGAMASLAIVVNGLITVIGASFFAMLY